MKLITFDQIQELKIDVKQCYQWVADMIKNKSDTMLPPKISMKPSPEIFINFMPSFVNRQVGGIKIVSRYPERTPSLDSKLILLDITSGEYLAIMDADWITTMRTGAVAVHSIKLLAKQDYSTIGMIGLGNTARATLLTLAEIESAREFEIKLFKYKGQEKIFAERFKDYKNLHFTFTDDYSSTVRDSDVVISCVTYAKENFAADSDFKEGCLVVPIHTLGFTNCDLFFDKVYADDYGHVCHFKYFDRFKQFAEVSDVVNNRVKGREDDRERILVYNIGLSIHDVYFASNIYNMLKDSREIENFDFEEPTEKFWV